MTTLAVLAGLAACESVGELSPAVTAIGAGALAAGMVFSHLTRRKPWPAVKIVLAITVVAVFAVFVHEVLGQAEAGNLASVEGPLAVLFVWIQVTHAFDVPARRDLLFSIVASAAFVAVASAQAIQTSFLVVVSVWLVLCVIALTLSWRSMAGAAGRWPVGTIALCSALAATVAALLVAVLPAPHPSQLITLPNSLTSRLPLPNAGGLAGGSSGTQPAEPALPGGRLGVGGFEGFAGTLDTAIRGELGDQVVMRVRTTRPGYLEALSYREWNGSSWLNPPAPRSLITITGGSPFDVALGRNAGQPSAASGPTGASGDVASPPPLTATPTRSLDIETFYVAQPLTNILVASPDPLQVWFPAGELYADTDDGSLRSPIAVTPGTVYTVVSSNTQQPPGVLAADRAPASLFATGQRADLQLPHPYSAVQALAKQITDRAGTVYGRIEALEQWMTTHVHYSTDIPPLLPGQDAVTQFLFHGRIGYCEQISTALAVMLRSIGIPAREVTGYVPGPFNPLTDLYEVQAKDAHAWVEVWFPGYGWQSFDPTANVPLANPSPGSVIAGDLERLVEGLPLLPIGLGLAAALALALAARAAARRPRTWAERVGARTRAWRGSAWNPSQPGRDAGRVRRPAPGRRRAAGLQHRGARARRIRRRAAGRGDAPRCRARCEALAAARVPAPTHTLSERAPARSDRPGASGSSRRRWLEHAEQLDMLGHREQVEGPQRAERPATLERCAQVTGEARRIAGDVGDPPRRTGSRRQRGDHLGARTRAAGRARAGRMPGGTRRARR